MASGSLSSSPEVSAAPDAAVCVSLPERLDTSAAFALRSLIEQVRGAAGEKGAGLDASGVAYVGGLGLQVLLASGCRLVAASEPVREAYALFGVSAFLSEPLTPAREQ
jgi:chemotaxis protein CheX